MREDQKKKFIYSLLIHCFFAVTIIVFGPFEIFISNRNDYLFTFRDFAWILVACALVYLIAAMATSMLLRGILYDILHLLVFSFTMCCYAQAMLMNGKMKALTGESVTFSIPLRALNLCVWGIFFLFVLISYFYRKKIMQKVIKVICILISGMQLVALVSLLFTTPVLTEEKNGYFSTKGMQELSANTNVIVFILDFFDGRYMEELLQEDESLLEPFKGFTYFPNATSVHSRTYPSIPYILTGQKCFYNEEPADYINDAYEESSFLPTLKDNQVNLGLYTYEQYVGSSIKHDVYNYTSQKPSISIREVIRYSMKMVLYRDMPYFAKNRFLYDIDDLNSDVLQENTDSDQPQKYQIFQDEWFAQELQLNQMKANLNEDSFRFFHLGSCQLNLDDPLPTGKRSLEIVNQYLQEMENLGIYQDATIILMADHGHSGGGDTLDLPQKTAVPLMMVKPAGKGMKDELVVSEAPVSQTDFMATVADGFGLDTDSFGSTVFDITDQSRERFYYYTALYSATEGEVELREYSVNSDARKASSYVFTGQKWKIQKSDNKVAQQ